MLANARLVAFAATTDAPRAMAFYQGRLGLPLISDDDFALAFESNGTQLRIQKVQQLTPPPFTVLGWQVPDIQATISALSSAGVTFEHYSFMQQDAAGVWTAPGGTKVAWFKDPDENLLSLSEPPAAEPVLAAAGA